MQNLKENLQKRAELLQQLRSFFYQRGVLEIDAPLLSPTAVTDLHIESIPAMLEQAGENIEHYLITSPEFFMKRLLAEGSGSIFYLGKVFRQEEHGKKHHHEFTMLEWYRLDWDEHELMEEIIALLHFLLPENKIKKISYGDLFQSFFNQNPYTVTLEQLKKLVAARIDITQAGLSLNDCFDLLFSHCIEPQLKEITLVYDYPVSQAALARKGKNSAGDSIARRFEVFIDDVELANGYYELVDSSEQRERFQADLAERHAYGKKLYRVDESLLHALEKGLPACAGVALGVDRLLMKILKTSSLEEISPIHYHQKRTPKN